MKQLNEHTAEAWMLDYLEGHLSDVDTRKLLDFVAQHPHWKEVLEEMQGDALPILEATESLPTKAHLHRDEEDDLIALMEGTLGPADAARMEMRLEQHPALDTSYQLYLQTRLRPQESLRFGNKKALKHTPVRLIYALRFSAAAATIAAIVGAWLWFNPNHPGQYSPRIATEMPVWETETVETQSTFAANDEQTERAITVAKKAPVKPKAQKKETNTLLASTPGQNTSESPEPFKTSEPETAAEPPSLALWLEPLHTVSLVVEEVKLPAMPANADKTAAPNPQWMNMPERGFVGDAVAGLGENVAGWGEKMAGRLKFISRQQQVISIEHSEEDELITSTFRLGQLELQRSRTKK
ncbi:MAG: hypothetical protein EA392_04115 [Cryomorphaceae bacterium]|nr:MAG: hypothetical protein EA392_04115 [Cryomorphaceae bacterium]